MEVSQTQRNHRAKEMDIAILLLVLFVLIVLLLARQEAFNNAREVPESLGQSLKPENQATDVLRSIFENHPEVSRQQVVQLVNSLGSANQKPEALRSAMHLVDGHNPEELEKLAMSAMTLSWEFGSILERLQGFQSDKAPSFTHVLNVTHQDFRYEVEALAIRSNLTEVLRDRENLVRQAVEAVEAYRKFVLASFLVWARKEDSDLEQFAKETRDVFTRSESASDMSARLGSLISTWESSSQ